MIRSRVAVPPSGDGRIERRGEDPLVLREQVVGELVEVADPADHRRSRHDLIAVRGELRQQRDVLGIALDEPVARVTVVRLGQPTVLREVIEPDDVVPGLQQLGDEVAVDESGGAGHEDAHLEPDPLSHGAPHVDDIPATHFQAPIRLVRRTEYEDVTLLEHALQASSSGDRRRTGRCTRRARRPMSAICGACRTAMPGCRQTRP